VLEQCQQLGMSQFVPGLGADSFGDVGGRPDDVRRGIAGADLPAGDFRPEVAAIQAAQAGDAPVGFSAAEGVDGLAGVSAPFLASAEADIEAPSGEIRRTAVQDFREALVPALDAVPAGEHDGFTGVVKHGLLEQLGGTCVN
jgi:hypothetical protein